MRQLHEVENDNEKGNAPLSPDIRKLISSGAVTEKRAREILEAESKPRPLMG